MMTQSVIQYGELAKALEQAKAVQIFVKCLLGLTEKNDAMAYVRIDELSMLYELLQLSHVNTAILTEALVRFNYRIAVVKDGKLRIETTPRNVLFEISRERLDELIAEADRIASQVIDEVFDDTPN